MVDPVVEDPKVVEDETPVDVKEGDKPPESVPWTKYVGIKEKFTRVEGELKTKISGLEEQAKNVVSTEDHKKVTEELAEAKKKLTDAEAVVKEAAEKTSAEKKETLVKRGVPEDKVKDLSDKELDNLDLVLSAVGKPKPDTGGGASSVSPESSKDKMKAGFEALHPQK